MIISVALATFDGERFIADQLRSILTQSVAVDQIVIADDGSSDRTVETAQAILSRETCEVTVLSPVGKPIGVAKNFQRAIERCDGDVIALADQDDFWHTDKLESMLGALGDDLLAFSDADLVDASGEKLTGAPKL